jgi:hypothetical protein
MCKTNNRDILFVCLYLSTAKPLLMKFGMRSQHLKGHCYISSVRIRYVLQSDNFKTWVIQHFWVDLCIRNRLHLIQYITHPGKSSIQPSWQEKINTPWFRIGSHSHSLGCILKRKLAPQRKNFCRKMFYKMSSKRGIWWCEIMTLDSFR